MQLKFLDPGKLRAQLSLQKIDNISDGQGGTIGNWSSIAHLFGHIEPLNAVARKRGRVDETVLTHRITIRYRQDIKTGQRFLRGARIFLIRSLYDIDETRRYFICYCEEVLS